MEKRAGLSKSL